DDHPLTRAYARLPSCVDDGADGFVPGAERECGSLLVPTGAQQQVGMIQPHRVDPDTCLVTLRWAYRSAIEPQGLVRRAQPVNAPRASGHRWCHVRQVTAASGQLFY